MLNIKKAATVKWTASKHKAGLYPDSNAIFYNMVKVLLPAIKCRQPEPWPGYK